MLYKRSSFIKWLQEVHDCEIQPIGERDTFAAFRVKNGPAQAYIGTDSKDRIDYEEIQLICRRLWLPLPQNSDLKRIDY